jgi:uncharacterized protein (DUF58 family)
MAERAVYDGQMDPAQISALDGLEVVACRIVEGFLAGMHRSPFMGSSVEFAEHRPYTAGDELRTIDWRVWAKSDRYYVKQFEEETNMPTMLVVDASGSMGLGLSTVTKLHYARLTAAILSRLLLHQRDAVGLAVLDTTVRDYIPARSTPTHFRAITRTLEATQAGGETSLAGVLHELAVRFRRRGLVVVCSDCLEELEPLRLALTHLGSRGHEVLLFHVMTPEELDFRFDNWTRFQDLEMPGVAMDLDPATVRRHYLAELGKWLAGLRAVCAESGVEYVAVRTDQPLIDILMTTLKQRARRRVHR